MAFRVAELYADITTRDGKFKSSMKDAKRSIEELNRKMEKIGRAARNIFLVGATAIAALAKAASDFEETQAKFIAVFKEQADVVKAWADTYGKAIGRGRTEMMKFLAQIQDTFVPLGVARDKAADLSRQVVKLGIDLASFNNVADAQVIDNLQSALTGMGRAVMKYGIIITDATTKQELFRMGVKKAWKEVTVQEKVQARLNIMMRSSTDAQDDALRTAKSFENQMKALKAELLDLAVAAGTQLIPTLKVMVTSFRDVAAGTLGWVEGNQKLARALADTAITITGGAGLLYALMKLGPLLLANPYTVLAAAVGAVALAFWKLNKQVDGFIELTEAAQGAGIGELEKNLGLADVQIVNLESHLAKLQKQLSALPTSWMMPFMEVPKALLEDQIRGIEAEIDKANVHRMTQERRLRALQKDQTDAAKEQVKVVREHNDALKISLDFMHALVGIGREAAAEGPIQRWMRGIREEAVSEARSLGDRIRAGFASRRRDEEFARMNQGPAPQARGGGATFGTARELARRIQEAVRNRAAELATKANTGAVQENTKATKEATEASRERQEFYGAFALTG